MSHTSSSTVSLSAPSSSSTTSRPNAPSTCALATPGMRRTGSSTTAACSCQRGNGSNGSRSKCTRRPLCQRSGGVTPSGALSAAPFRPIARLVVWATDCTTGAASSTTGLASVCKTPAASAAVCTPARTTCAAPPVTPATRLATGLTTPGIFMRHPSITCTAPILLASYQPVHTDPRVCGPLVRRPRIDPRGSGATTLGAAGADGTDPVFASARLALRINSAAPVRPRAANQQPFTQICRKPQAGAQGGPVVRIHGSGLLRASSSRPRNLRRRARTSSITGWWLGTPKMRYAHRRARVPHRDFRVENRAYRIRWLALPTW